MIDHQDSTSTEAGSSGPAEYIHGPAEYIHGEAEYIHGIEPATRLPFGVSRYYAGLAQTEDPEIDPIAAQFMPREKELVRLD
ncbi:MAG TPA: hypothetical protein VMV03_10140, partial [Spirochaetia bacterium]|nr:hypothetical protein [Spirochaetia bacterium]